MSAQESKSPADKYNLVHSKDVQVSCANEDSDIYQ